MNDVVLTDFLILARDTDFFLGITQEGMCYIWEHDENTQHTSITDTAVKIPILFPFPEKIVDAGITNGQCVFCTETGDVYTFLTSELRKFWNEHDIRQFSCTQYSLPEPIFQVHSVSQQNYAVSQQGSLYAWGDCNLNEPHQIIPSPSPICFSDPVLEVAVGHRFACLLTAQGKVYAWGSDDFGQLGNGDGRKSYFPLRILHLSNIQKIVCGGFHVLALDKNGDVFSWGWNHCGQTGIGKYPSIQVSPSKLLLPGKAADIAAGWVNSYVKLEDSRVFGWGKADNGELGSTYIKNQYEPGEISLPDTSLQTLPFRFHGMTCDYKILERELRKGYQRELEL